MGTLDSERSLPVLRDDKTGISPMAKKLRLATGHRVAVLNAPSGYRAFVAIDDHYTALRFKRA